ncbi:hypothetical protein [Mesobacillus stamsii]|uniref:Uncharacterized protein n=1 Tax=Mesobacillus stamsii TaxID=225347 RepID=A0ABU0FXJ1_9BACI|nr:hypothetical protein [Mesobacillus stamsii]MDQ0414054.1 hypothetical protein [Mesobacillus stamsii]
MLVNRDNKFLIYPNKKQVELKAVYERGTWGQVYCPILFVYPRSC